MASRKDIPKSLRNIPLSDVEPFNRRKLYVPDKIFIPVNVDEVAKIVTEAKKLGIRVCPRGGGHSYASYGLGGEDGVWLIDLQKFNEIKVNEDGKTAIVGAGNRLGRVVIELYKKKKAIPTGSCPTVGISGHALHGGFGFISRTWGLALDAVVSLEVVLADGTVNVVDRDSDLFWALLGAGSSFGVVTQFLVRLEDPPDIGIHFCFKFDGTNPTERTELFEAFQFIAKYLAPRNLAFRLRILADYTEITGVYWIFNDNQRREHLEQLLGEFKGRLKNIRLAEPHIREGSWDEVLSYTAYDEFLQKKHRKLMEELDFATYTKAAIPRRVWPELHDYLEKTNPAFAKDPEVPPDSLEIYKTGFDPLAAGATTNTSFATSLVVNDLVQSKNITQLFKYIQSVHAPPGYDWVLSIDTYGGKYSHLKNAYNSKHSCYSFRDCLFTMQFYIGKVNRSPPFSSEAIDFMHYMRNEILVSIRFPKLYMNFVDPEDKYRFAAYNYYKNEDPIGEGDDRTVYQKLKDLKQQYDPTYLFWNPQCIGAEDRRVEGTVDPA